MKPLNNLAVGLTETYLKLNERWSVLCRRAVVFGVALGLSTISCLAQTTNYTTFITIVGSSTAGSSDGVGTNASFNFPKGVVADHKFNVFLSDTGNSTIRKITTIQTNWLVSTIAGAARITGANDNPTNALLSHFDGNTGIAVNSAGDIFVADTMNDTIRELYPSGSNTWGSTTIAGTAGVNGTNDNPTNALEGLLYRPWGICVDTNNNLFVADSFNQTIRMLTPVGTNWGITTIAGVFGVTGTNDGSNLGGVQALFNFPKGIAVDAADDVYVADTTNFIIRKITQSGSNWVVTTIAGLGGSAGSADGTNSGARFFAPAGIAVDSSNNVYVADTGNEIVRKIVQSGSNYVVSTIGGVAGVAGYADGTATNAEFADLESICVDFLGNLFMDGNSVQAGVITLTVQGGDAPPFIDIEVVLAPQAAVTDGAAWTLAGSSYSFGGQKGVPYVLPVSTFPSYLLFSNLIGWNVPVSAPITVSGSFCEITDLPYTVVPPVLSITKPFGLGITGTTNTTYVIQYSSSLFGPWSTLTPPASPIPPLVKGINLISAWPPPWPPDNNSSMGFYRAQWTGN